MKKSRILLIRRKYVVALALIVAVAAIFYLIYQAGVIGSTNPYTANLLCL